MTREGKTPDNDPGSASGKLMRTRSKTSTGRHRRSVELPVRSASRFPLTERRLASVWRTVLNVDTVTASDDFFELGGDSPATVKELLIQLIQEFRVLLSLEELFDNPTLAAMAERVALIGATQSVPIPSRREGGLAVDVQYFPVSDQQLAWIRRREEEEYLRDNVPAAQVEGVGPFKMTFPIRIRGRLDVEVMQKCLAEMVRRHEILRTRFVMEEGKPPLQEVLPFTGFDVPLEDLSDLDRDEQEEQIGARVALYHESVASRDEGPLFEVTLFRQDPEEHVLILCIDHVNSDGWSMGIFFEELQVFYDSLSAGEEPNLPVPIQYGDYASAQESWMQGQVLERHLSHWRDRLTDMPPRLRLNIGREVPESRAAFLFALSRELVPEATGWGVRELSEQLGCSLFCVLLTAYAVLQVRFSGHEDVIIASIDANRVEETRKLFGQTLKLIPARIRIDPDQTFEELAQEVWKQYVGDLEFREMPNSEFFIPSTPDRPGFSSSGFFSSFFNYLAYSTKAGILDLKGLECEAFRPPAALEDRRVLDFPLRMIVEPDLHVNLVYDSEALSPEEAQLVQAEYRRILQAVADDKTQTIAALISVG